MIDEYIQWAQDTIKQFQDLPQYSFFITGIYKSLVEIFKIGQREELLSKINLVIPILTQQSEDKTYAADNNALVRLLKVKLAQRIGLLYLKQRRITWLYNRGSRSLKISDRKENTVSKLVTNVSNLASQLTKSSDNKIMEEELDEESYFTDVDPENLENIIDFLLNSLKDKDTNVRWSSAKGIGRITSRLNAEMADDIISSILDLFQGSETDSAWHGGCFALGELSRRGLLLPKRLQEVFPIIYKALLYDLNQGNYNVGANVRDGACYVAWAFARAYDSEVIDQYMPKLAQYLLQLALFDREVNCRRAASAAFQEHVGRQGSFPHGIQILTEADYFTLGVRSNAYLNVSVFVSSFEEYYPGFVEHLAFDRLRHIDQDIRRLAAATLSQICVFNPNFVIEKIIPQLINNCTDDMIYVRQGSIYGIGDILIGLSGKSHLHNMHDVMKDSIFLKSFTKNDKKLMKAGEYSKLLDENIKSPTEVIQKAAVKSLRVFMSIYGQDAQNKYIQDFIENVIKSSKDKNIYVTRGYALAVGVLHPLVISQNKEQIYSLLVENCQIKPKEQDDIDARMFTVESISQYINSLFITKNIDTEIFEKCFNLCFQSMNDYTSDQRGDIGSAVRVASMQTQLNLIKGYCFYKNEKTQLSQILLENMFQLILQQLAEKMDRTRLVAGLVIQELVDNYFTLIPEFSAKQLFYDKFCRNNIKELVLGEQQLIDKEFANTGAIGQIVDSEATANLEDKTKEFIYNWNLPHCSFPIVFNFIHIPQYSYHIIKGMIISVGGLTESVVKHSSQALMNYITEILETNKNIELINQFFGDFLKLLKDYSGDDRILTPAYKTLEILLDKEEIVRSEEFSSFAIQIYEQIRLEIKGKSSILKLSSCAPVVIQLLISKVSQETYVNMFKTVHYLLSHSKFPKLRKITADKYYLFLMSYGEELFDSEFNDSLCEFLLEYEWSEIPENEIKEVKAKIEEKNNRIAENINKD